MSKHFKMYIKINNKEVAVVSVFSDNIKHKFVKPWMLHFGLSSKEIVAGTYTRRDLIDLKEGKIEITQFDNDS